MADDNDFSSEKFVIKDPEALAHNLARFLEEAGNAMSAYLKPLEEGKASPDFADHMTEAVKTVSTVANYWTSDPARALEAQTNPSPGPEFRGAPPPSSGEERGGEGFSLP